MINFIRAHLKTLYDGRQFDNEEYNLLQEIMQESADEVILGAYELFCLNQNDFELVETLKLLAKLEIDEVELDYGSPIQESYNVEETKAADYQRDSWPHGFQTMVDRTKALKILEEFKPFMSSVKYTILYGVALSLQQQIEREEPFFTDLILYSSLVKKDTEEYELYKKFLISMAGDKPSTGLRLMCGVLQTPQISRHPSISYLLKVEKDYSGRLRQR